MTCHGMFCDGARYMLIYIANPWRVLRRRKMHDDLHEHDRMIAARIYKHVMLRGGRGGAR